jgi:uncharacterized protein (TIGR03492 family)
VAVILIVSNGFAEDLVGARIASGLIRADGIDVAAFPLVGQGEPYKRKAVRVVGSQQLMPSGGFARTSLRSMYSDLRAGLAGCLFRQAREMRLLSSQVSLTLCVGDVFLLCMCALGRLPRRFLLATAKSEYISGHLPVEAWLMRRLAVAVAARDQRTAESLERRGVRSYYFGNFLMDVIDRSGRRVSGAASERLVCLLPGSRSDFALNLHDMLLCLEALPCIEGLDFVVLLAREPEPADMTAALPNASWSYSSKPERAEPGHAGDLVFGGEQERGRLSVRVVSGRFGDYVDACDLVIGMAGTAVEQAAGIGKPAVTFPGRGAQFTRGFARAQKRLLGDAVCLVESSDPAEVAKEVCNILSDPDRYARMSRAGLERMGQGGAVMRLIEYLRSMGGVADGA